MNAPLKRITPPAIRARKGGEPIVCLTSYAASTTRLIDPHVDLILVGDSLAMTIYGMESTVGVTVDTMIAHGWAVASTANHACVVVDLPFGSYEESPAQAFRTAARVMSETGCAAVKLEGGIEMAETIRFLSARGVPVDEAGAFSVVIEKTAEQLSREITERISAPTIGIGASVACDGQILVIDDVIGLFTAFRPKFVKRYAEVAQPIAAAAQAYAAEVRSRAFPGPEHVFGP
jgi:3-methyl-2-oxobutanoate hydroxymethyltransferase